MELYRAMLSAAQAQNIFFSHLDSNVSVPGKLEYQGKPVSSGRTPDGISLE